LTLLRSVVLAGTETESSTGGWHDPPRYWSDEPLGEAAVSPSRRRSASVVA